VVPESLRDAPAVDRLVVCHGDACMPNTLLDAEGRPIAVVDLAALGTADRWADIAVASMSTEWNYGPGWEDALIEAYGLEPDRERLAYYRDLWNAT
jgi:kanamycin kinase